MSSSRVDDADKHVIGYPTTYPPPHPADHASTYVGYPYIAPPPSRKPNRMVRCVVASLIFFLLILTTISFFMWVILRPQLPEFYVDSATLPPLNTTASNTSINWEVTFLINNPNKKMGILYDGMETALFYGEANLTETDLVPFVQQKSNKMALEVMYVEVDEIVGRVFSGNLKSGKVSMNVQMVSWVRFQVWNWRTSAQLMGVICTDISVILDSSSGVGRYAGDLKCKVDFVE